MLKIESTEVMGWGAAIRGMRNPKNSWEKSDSLFGRNLSIPYAQNNPIVLIDKNGVETFIGDSDLKLMMQLRNAGTDHRKFMRMIVVYVDVTAPLYWWKEFDTYKVGTVANSCSTMHKIADKEFTLEDFSHEHLIVSDDVNHIDMVGWLQKQIDILNEWRLTYLDCSPGNPYKKEYWWQMIQLLPSSYNQRRTVMLNYEVLANMYKSRRHHKLDEWHTFCDWIEGLPYSELITGANEVRTSAESGGKE
jgi:hypothetical protein